MNRLRVPANGPAWLPDYTQSIERSLRSVSTPQSFVVANVPSATGLAGSIIYVPDEAGGAVMAFSDGTDWRRVTDRAVIS